VKGLLQEGPTRQAVRQPEAVAVAGSSQSLTYGQLESASNRLANALRRSGCRREDRLALFLPKSPTAITAMLGALKSDAAYVPVDTSLPAGRAARILGKTEARFALVTSAGADLLKRTLAAAPVADLRVGWLEETDPPSDLPVAFTRRDLEGESDAHPDVENDADDPAHILFTSGSTGEPKGVVITHASVMAFLDWAIGYFGMAPADRISGHPPLHFDLSTFDVYGTLTAGAALHLVDGELSLLPHRLADFIRESRLTQWFSVPSILTYLAKFDVVGQDDFPSLKRLLWCGEVLPTPVLVYWMKRLPHVQFTNLYGPTEATIASSFYTVTRLPDRESEPIPIGAACPGEELRVLGDDLRPVAPGDIGDLFIGGVGLSPGYWRDPERTAAAFVVDPVSRQRLYRTGDLARIGPGGVVHYLGRSDSQIKSRGYRIELGEIEAALSTMTGLVEVAAVGVPTEGFEGTAICCAYVPSEGSPLEPTLLRRHLAQSLPAYMIPMRWLSMERLPKNQNGKIDRRRVREIFTEKERAQTSGSLARQ
jgi:amino acid adenylation domain-containing protein